MRILVTGGAGYIGRVATSILLKRGFDVTVLDDCSTGHRESVSESVRFIEGSILNHDDIAQGLIDCQAVLHFAGLSIVADSMKYPDRYWQVNVDGAKNLLDGMRRVKVEKLVFSSSAAVYGEVKSIPIAESAATHPTNPYGATKLAIEKLIEAEIKNSELGAISLRYFNVAGAMKVHDIWLGERHSPETHLIPNVLNSAKDNPISIYGDDWETSDGTCVRDYVHVVDLVEAHLLALNSLQPKSHRAINLGSGRGYSVREIIDTASSVQEREIPSIVSDRRPGDPAQLIADISLAEEFLKWKPTRNLKEMIADSAAAL